MAVTLSGGCLSALSGLEASAGEEFSLSALQGTAQLNSSERDEQTCAALLTPSTNHLFPGVEAPAASLPQVLGTG